MPCSYWPWVGASSPTEAKWPFIVITEGAVGNLEATEGLLEVSLEVWPFALDMIAHTKKEDGGLIT